MKRVMVALRISEGALQIVDQEAQELGVTRSEMIRSLLGLGLHTYQSKKERS